MVDSKPIRFTKVLQSITFLVGVIPVGMINVILFYHKVNTNQLKTVLSMNILTDN